MWVVLNSRLQAWRIAMNTRFKQLLRVSMYFAAAALAVNAVRLAVIRASVQVGPESAFTVVLQETVTNPSGNARAGSTQTQAVRSDGSRVLKLGSIETGSRLIWFASGIEVMTNDRLRLKSTIRKSDGAVHRDPRSGCTERHVSNEQSSGEETVAGYRSAKVVVVHDAAPERRTKTTWYALDHGCAVIKTRANFGDVEASEWRLLTLIPGEPQESLFDIPPDYQEGPPSALDGPLDVVRCGPECQERRKRQQQARDADYYKNRP
jgi:hypothetical protein